MKLPSKFTSLMRPTGNHPSTEAEQDHQLEPEEEHRDREPDQGEHRRQVAAPRLSGRRAVYTPTRDAHDDREQQSPSPTSSTVGQMRELISDVTDSLNRYDSPRSPVATRPR